MDRITRKNIIKSWCAGAMQASANSFLSVLSVFFLFYGMTELQIGFHSSITQVLGLTASLSCSGIASGFHDSRKPIAIMLVIRAALVIGYTLFCIWTTPVDFFYICMLIIGSLLAIESSLRTIFEYKLPCETINIEYYSVRIGYLGLFNGISGTVIGIAIPILYSRYDFVAVTMACLIAAAVCNALGLIFNLSMEPLKKQETDDFSRNTLQLNPFKALNTLLHNKDFVALLPSNLIRGFGAGMFALLTVIAIRRFGITEGEATVIASFTSVGTLLTSAVYVPMVKRFGTPMTGLIGSLVFGVICVSMVGSFQLFLVLYCIAYIGYNIVGTALPNMVYQSVDQSIISSFHTWRMAASSLGAAIFTPVYSVLIDILPPSMLLCISFVFILLCMIGYYLRYKNRLQVGNKT